MVRYDRPLKRNQKTESRKMMRQEIQPSSSASLAGTSNSLKPCLLDLNGTSREVAAVFADFGPHRPLTINEVAYEVSKRLRSEGKKPFQIHSVSPRIAELDERGLGIIRECTAADDNSDGPSQWHVSGGKKAGPTRRQRCWVFTSWDAARPRGERKTYRDLYLNERAKRTSSRG